jgi:hypothetical protein
MSRSNELIAAFDVVYGKYLREEMEEAEEPEVGVASRLRIF